MIFIGILPSNALTQSECNALTNLSQTELEYTVVTCDNPFNLSVNMGQRLHIQNPSGGSANMLPSASYGNPGTYQYSSGSTSGTIKLQNPPDIGISFDNVQVSFSGSQMSVSGSIVNSNNFPVKNLHVYWHVTDSSGNYLTAWLRYGNDGQAYGAQIQAQSTGTFSETVCCLPSSGASTATPYIVQAFREDGTKLISTSTQPTQPTDGQFTLPCSMQEKGDGVSSSSCNGLYENGIAKAKVGIQYHSGLFPIKNYKAIGFFIDKNGNQGQNIQVTIDQINPKESKELVFANAASGFVSEFKMQMLGGELVTEPEPVPQPSPNPPSEVTIEMAKGTATNTECADKCYMPSKVNVAVGTTVTWKNVDNAAHTATDTNGAFDSSLVMAKGSFKHKFDKAGYYNYMCIVHPWMQGTIVVGSGVSSNTQSNTNTQIPTSATVFTISTDKSSYADGDSVLISGFVNNLDENNAILVTLRIVGPLVNGVSSRIVSVTQVQPQSDGSFENIFIVSGPPWQSKGDYKIIVNYGSQKTETTFHFNGGSGKGIVDAPPSKTIKCPNGQVIVDGQCVVQEKQKSMSKEQMEIERQKAELTKEKQKLDLEKQKLELQKQKDELTKQKKELQQQKDALVKEKTQPQKTDSSKSVKTKEQLTKEKAEQIKKEKELAKKNAIEKSKEKAKISKTDAEKTKELKKKIAKEKAKERIKAKANKSTK